MYPPQDAATPNYRIARELARKLLKSAKITTFPVLIKSVARFVPDLLIDGAELQNDLSGMQISYKGKDFIRYNKTHSSTRNRFTLSHEIGHVLLGHTVQGYGLFSATKEQEREANVFAAELLMPLQFMKKALIKYRTVDDLASAFWVSKEAMTARVMETGLYAHLTSFNKTQ